MRERLESLGEVVADGDVLQAEVGTVLDVIIGRPGEVAVRVVLAQTGNSGTGVGGAPGIQDVRDAVEAAFHIGQDHLLAHIGDLVAGDALQHHVEGESLPVEAAGEGEGILGHCGAHILTVIVIDLAIVVEVDELQVAGHGVRLDAVAVLGVGGRLGITLEDAGASL